MVIRKDILAFVNALYKLQIIDSLPPRRHLWVKSCPVCERNHNTACQGAIIEIGKEEPLRFNLYKVRDGMRVQADISIKTKRGGGKPLHLNEHNVLVRLWHVDG